MTCLMTSWVVTRLRACLSAGWVRTEGPITLSVRLWVVTPGVVTRLRACLSAGWVGLAS